MFALIRILLQTLNNYRGSIMTMRMTLHPVDIIHIYY